MPMLLAWCVVWVRWKAFSFFFVGVVIDAGDIFAGFGP